MPRPIPGICTMSMFLHVYSSAIFFRLSWNSSLLESRISKFGLNFATESRDFGFLMASMHSRSLATSFICSHTCSAANSLRISLSRVSLCGHAAIWAAALALFQAQRKVLCRKKPSLWWCFPVSSHRINELSLSPKQKSMESSPSGYDSLELVLQFFSLEDLFASPARLRQRTPTHSLSHKRLGVAGKLRYLHASVIMKHFSPVGLSKKKSSFLKRLLQIWSWAARWSNTPPKLFQCLCWCNAISYQPETPVVLFLTPIVLALDVV